MDVAGLVLGSVSIVMGVFGPLIFNEWMAIIAFPLSVLGLILSVISGKKSKDPQGPSTVAVAGLIVCIVGSVLTGITFFSCGVCILGTASSQIEIDSLVNIYN